MCEGLLTSIWTGRDDPLLLTSELMFCRLKGDDQLSGGREQNVAKDGKELQKCLKAPAEIL